MANKPVNPGGKDVTTNKSGSGSETWHYDKHGRATHVTDKESNGSSHNHNVGRGILGPFKGSRK